MKRNLISVIILAFSIINFILLAIIVFTVIPTNKKTDNLITSIASIIDTSLENAGEEKVKKVPLSDQTIYTSPEDSTITLKSVGEDKHYAQVRLSIALNKKSKDFKKFDPSTDTGIGSYESAIQSAVRTEIEKYSPEECTNNAGQIEENCQKAIKDLFNSDVIYDVTFSKFVVS